MKDLSLRERIRKYLRKQHPDWINGGEVERLSLLIGKKASNASRRLRELCEDGIIEREEKRNENTGIKSVWYRYKMTEHEILSISMKKINENTQQL